MKTTRKYRVNESFFDQIDTPTKAWVLGFLAADGCVQTDGLVWRVDPRDRDVLVSIKEAIETAAPIREHKSISNGIPRVMSSLCVYSRLLVQACQRLGLNHRKSWSLCPPTLDRAFESAFWLGCFDGDGWLDKDERKGRLGWQIGYCGTWEMVDGFSRFAERHIGFYREPRRLNAIWRVTYGDIRDVQTLLRALHAGCPVSLSRKQLLADHVLTLSRKIADWSWLTPQVLNDLKATHHTWQAVARELGIPWQHLRRIRRRLLMPKDTRWPANF